METEFIVKKNTMRNYTRFLRVPMFLFRKDSPYCMLSTKAKMIYSLMLLRAYNSRWSDDNGNVIFKFNTAKIANALGLKKRGTAEKCIKELSSTNGNQLPLVNIYYKQNGYPNQYYINYIKSDNTLEKLTTSTKSNIPIEFFMCPLYALEDYINLKCEEKSLYSYLFELVNRHGIRHNAYGINGLHVVIDDLKSLTRIFNCCEKT